MVRLYQHPAYHSRPSSHEVFLRFARGLAEKAVTHKWHTEAQMTRAKEDEELHAAAMAWVWVFRIPPRRSNPTFRPLTLCKLTDAPLDTILPRSSAASTVSSS